MAVIAVAQLKGGAGRSTIATNLAVGLGDSALVDADPPQFSAAAWASMRDADTPPAIATHDHREMAEAVALLSDRHAYVVIDCPPRAAEVTRAALALADLALVPVTPGIGDLWAVQDLTDTLKAAEKLNKGLTVRLVWNRLRAYVASEVELQEQARKDLGIRPLTAALGYRTEYPKAFFEGRSVLEGPNAKAREEMTALVAQVKRLVR